jgi:hypothetical protein
MMAYTNYYLGEADFLEIKYFIILLVKKEEVDFLAIKLIIFLFLVNSSELDLFGNYFGIFIGFLMFY